MRCFPAEYCTQRSRKLASVAVDTAVELLELWRFFFGDKLEAV